MKTLDATRVGLRWLGRVSPRLATGVVERLWFAPPHRPVDSQPLPPGFEPFDVIHGERRLAGFAGGDGDVALLVHGWGGNAGQMLPLARHLAESGYRVVAVDLPGHGSDRSRRSDVLQMAAGLRSVIEQVGAIDVLVVHSLGAPVTFLATSEPRPRSVLLAPILGVDYALDSFSQMLQLSPNVAAALRTRIHRFLEDASVNIEMTEAPWGNQLLIFHDPDDQRAPVEASRKLASISNDVTLVETAGLGHNRILASETVGDRMLGFLDSRSPGTPINHHAHMRIMEE